MVSAGETLCDEKNPIILEKMDFPDPVIKIAIEPKSKADLEKMGVGLNKLAQEDPSFNYSRDEETNQVGTLWLRLSRNRPKTVAESLTVAASVPAS